MCEVELDDGEMMIITVPSIMTRNPTHVVDGGGEGYGMYDSIDATLTNNSQIAFRTCSSVTKRISIRSATRQMKMESPRF